MREAADAPNRDGAPARLAPPRWGRLVAFVVILAAVALLSVLGALKGIDRRLAEARFSLLDRPASGSLVLVEIDAASLAALERWPWPRSTYANAIDTLNAAGAELIAFDIDFSSRSAAAEDERLATAIASASGRIILPTFRQAATSAGNTRIIEASPQTALSADAVLADVNVASDADGVVRQGSYGRTTTEGHRPTLAALLAGARHGQTGEYLIDFSIDVATVPRLSFVDVIEGRFERDAVRGKKILIGATALELGDEFVVPRYRIVPGAVVHALGYESILQGRALTNAGPIVAFLLAALVAGAILTASRRWSWRRLVTLNVLIIALALLAPLALEMAAPVQIDVGGALVAQALCIFSVMVRELHARAREILKHRTAVARHRAVIDATLRDISDGIVVTDEDGRIEIINQRAAYFFSKAGESLAGRSIEDVLPGLKTYVDAKAKAAAPGSRNEGPVRYQVNVKVQDGVRALEVTASRSDVAHASGRRAVFIYSLHDVTARVRFERAEAAAKKAAEEALAAKTSLLSTMSHELRTPLNAVIGFSDALLTERYGPLGAPQYSEFVGLIRQSGQRLLHIVNGVLEAARLDSGEASIVRAQVSVRALVRAARDSAAQKLDARRLTLELKASPQVDELSVDPQMFAWIIDELVANAIEFSPIDERIVIEVERDERNGIVIEARNKTPFIEPDKLKLLAQPFVQGDSGHAREHEGTGLGLFIVDRYVRLHGGSLELACSANGDFTARIRLPDVLVRKSVTASAA